MKLEQISNECMEKRKRRERAGLVVDFARSLTVALHFLAIHSDLICSNSEIGV